MIERHSVPRRGCRTPAGCRALAAAIALAAYTAGADVVPEEIRTRNLPPATPSRVYVTDVTIGHIVDGRIHIVDADKSAYQGMVSTALAGQTALAPDRSEIYVATTYFSKLNRGERVDQVDVYDAATLALKAEIAIPPRHAQALPYRGTLRASSDGRWLFVQNATPATSVSIVDLKARKFVAETALPGCWIILPVPSAPNRFVTLCGDGTMEAVTVDADGKTSITRSAKFFDPDHDALFVSGEAIGDRYHFVSYRGNVYVANVATDPPTVEAPWPLVSAAEAKAGWRPGGYQPVALHDKSGRIYVGMHPKGKEGSHKSPAKEIWAFDTASKKRIDRVPGHHATVIAASRGDAPRVFAYSTDKSSLAVFDASGKLKHLKTASPFGELATQLDVQ